MAFESYFRVVSYATIAAAALALFVDGGVGVWLGATFAVLMIIAWSLEGTRWQLSERVALVVILVSIPVFYFDWRVLMPLVLNEFMQRNGFTQTGGVRGTVEIPVLAHVILFLSAVKLLQRIPEPAQMALRAGRVPHLLALTVASWIATVAPPQGFDPGPYSTEVREPARHRLAEVTRSSSNPREHAMMVLRNGFLPDELTAHDAFTDRVADLVTVIARGGVRAAAQDATQAVNYREVS